MARTAIKQTQTPTAFDVSSLQNMPRQRRSHELTLRVLRAAERIIREVGYEGLTIAMVADEADVSIGGLYGRFRSRDEIMAAINRQLLQRIEQESILWTASVDVDATTTLVSFVDHLVQFFSDHGTLFPVSANSSGTSLVSEAARLEATLRERLSGALACHSDELAGVDVTQLSAMVVHLTLASLLRESSTREPVAGRSMSWPVLAKELPRVASAYLESVKAAAGTITTTPV